jgi:hypothetical protein
MVLLGRNELRNVSYYYAPILFLGKPLGYGIANSDCKPEKTGAEAPVLA